MKPIVGMNRLAKNPFYAKKIKSKNLYKKISHIKVNYIKKLQYLS